MKRRLYAIRDNKANDIVGGVQVFPAEAVAIRFFEDVASDTNLQSTIARHVEDFDLVLLAELMDDGSVDGYEQPVVVVTGTAWKALREAAAAANPVTKAV